MTDLQQAYDRIDQFAAWQMEKYRVPGLAVAITDRDQLLRVATYGYANLDRKTPVTPDHLFEFGSIGKSFTAVAMLQLRDEGKLDLQAPVEEYLPWFEVQSEHGPVTIHHLLSMTAGITNGTDFPTDKLYEIWALRETATAWPPGERFHYSNLGYKALGVILERIENKSYADIIRERMLEPLGMVNTDPAISHETRKRLVTGYQHFYDDRPWLPRHGHVPATWLETDTGDGCISSTPADLATYLRSLLNRGEEILSEDSFDAMAGQVISYDTDRSYGYGLVSSRTDGQMLIGHGGGMVGYYAYMLGDLNTGLGVIVMINGPGNSEELAHFAIRTLQAAASGNTVPDVPLAHDPASIDEAGDYAGEYQPLGSTRHNVLTLTAEGDRLSLDHQGERLPLLQLRDGQFLADHPDFWLFPFRFDRGRLFHGGDVYQRGHAEQPLDTGSASANDGYTGHYRSHNPWFSNFRIVDRLGTLYMIQPSGGEEELAPICEQTYRVGDTPETIQFDTFVDGQALRATHSCCPYYRFFTD